MQAKRVYGAITKTCKDGFLLTSDDAIDDDYFFIIFFFLT